MSRSRKRSPVYTADSRRSSRRRSAKKAASRTARRTADIPDGRGYRKVYNPYNICEYRFYFTEGEMRKAWECGSRWVPARPCPYEEVYRDWQKYYYRK